MLLNSLVTGGVAGDQLHPMFDGDSSNHRVGKAGGLAGAIKIAPIGLPAGLLAGETPALPRLRHR